MNLVKITPYAKFTKQVGGLFNCSCKIEAKWGRLIDGIDKKRDNIPVIPMKRLKKSAASIQRQLNELGFGIKD